MQASYMQKIKVLLADLGTHCIDFPKEKLRFFGGSRSWRVDG